MPTFGSVSLAQLKTCDSRLQFLFLEVVKTYDCKIVEGHRGKAAQDYAYYHGFSLVKYPAGNHNALPSRAADVYPYPIDPNMDSSAYTKQMHHFAGFVMATAVALKIPIRWGGAWDGSLRYDRRQKLWDTPHFELAPERPRAEVPITA